MLLLQRCNSLGKLPRPRHACGRLAACKSAYGLPASVAAPVSVKWCLKNASCRCVERREPHDIVGGINVVAVSWSCKEIWSARDHLEGGREKVEIPERNVAPIRPSCIFKNYG